MNGEDRPKGPASDKRPSRLQPGPDATGPAVQFLGIVRREHRLVARFALTFADRHETRAIPLECGPIWSPARDDEEPVPDPGLHQDLVTLAHKWLAVARSVSTVAQFDRGAHLHVRGRVA